MMHLVTGHAGTEHIKPSDDGAFNAGVVGTGKYVFDLGNKFSYEIVSNNLVKILDGELINQGRHMNIQVNNYEEVTIENGLQGVKRYDLICARYTKNADTSIESAELVVVKGTSSTTPSDPACVEGNILEGALMDDFPLYRVRLDGLNIVGVDCLFEVIPSLESVNNRLVKSQIFGTDGTPVGKLADGRIVYRAHGSIPINLPESTDYVETTIEHGVEGVADILECDVSIISTLFIGAYKLPYFEKGTIYTSVRYVSDKVFGIVNKYKWQYYILRFTMYYTKE